VDVARLAGVSQKTVSRVINGEPNVSEQLRDRVLSAARELGYRPNTAARALIQGRFNRIGVVSLGTSLYGPASLLVALERAAHESGYALTIVCTLEHQVGGISNAVDRLMTQGVDGIVISEPIDESEEVRLAPEVPVLSFGRLPTASGDARLVVATGDNVAGGRLATEHLLSLGHATVWHVAGPQRWWSARDRLLGWRQALAAAGAPEPPVLEGDWSAASGYALGRRLADTEGVTAINVANDDMAIGVIRALTEAGLKVPEQVSVVGFDDIPAAPYLCPPLTTVTGSLEVIATGGLELLVAQIEGVPGSPTELDVPLRLVARQSTAPPPQPSGPVPQPGPASTTVPGTPGGS
jgi:DNA-binding LacI/PurR family transcriptional regulator